jgi:aspartate carbamoyltransferase catalytic subunit
VTVMTHEFSRETFNAMRPKEVAPHLLGPGGEIQRLIYTQQFDRDALEHLIRLAEFIRSQWNDVKQMRYMHQLLAHRSCLLYFPQCSTRTFTSFSVAVQTLGMVTEEIRDPELSSMYKGESELDTLLTLAHLSDLIVLRQMDGELAHQFAYELLARNMDTRIINGGSGADAHPTQALLEMYTLSAYLDLERVDRNYTIAMVGDLKRSRTARSLSYLLALYPQINQVFVAPDELQMEEDIAEHLDENAVSYRQTDNLEEVIGDANAFYMMRIQDEYSTTSEQLRKKYEEFHLSTERVNRMRPDALILHPLPRRREMPIEIDDDPRARYWEAVVRGKYIRIALVLHMFGCDEIERLAARVY